MQRDDGKWLKLTVAAQRLGLPHQQTLRLVLTNVLRGELRGNRWFILESSVAELQRVRAVRVNAGK